MKNRSRTDIVSEILEIAQDCVTKTKIMYKAYLSYTQLKDYLAMLIQNKLLEYNKSEQTYRTTGKGMQFLSMNSQLGSLQDPRRQKKKR